MSSRKITHTITGEVTVFRKADITSTKNEGQSFPTLNIAQSVKQGEGYASIQRSDLATFSELNAAFADSIGVAENGNVRVVGTITMKLQKVRQHASVNDEGKQVVRDYPQWVVTSHSLVPSASVPYASAASDSTEETPKEEPATAGAPLVISDDLPF